jgi:hypothetical protein
MMCIFGHHTKHFYLSSTITHISLFSYSEHRDENNRIIREFLIGKDNIHHIVKQESRSAQ